MTAPTSSTPVPGRKPKKTKPPKLEVLDSTVYQVVKEIRTEAERRGSHSVIMDDWANRLEVSHAAFMEDIYEQLCEALSPIINRGMLPSSITDSVRELADFYMKHRHKFNPSKE